MLRFQMCNISNFAQISSVYIGAKINSSQATTVKSSWKKACRLTSEQNAVITNGHLIVAFIKHHSYF